MNGNRVASQPTSFSFIRRNRNSSEKSAIKLRNRPSDFSFLHLFLQILALVALILSSPNADLQLDPTIFPVEAKGNESESFLIGYLSEFPNLLFVQE